jgi:hypothetical protein
MIEKGSCAVKSSVKLSDKSGKKSGEETKDFKNIGSRLYHRIGIAPIP